MRQWISQQDVAFYVVTAVTIIGVILTAAANRAYKRLMKEADHVEESTNRLIKYIKLKYSSYYKNIKNIDEILFEQLKDILKSDPYKFIKSSDIIKENKKIIELVTSIDSRLNVYAK